MPMIAERGRESDGERHVPQPPALRCRHLADPVRPLDADLPYITFSSSQELVIVPEVRDKLLDAWGIDSGVRVGDFSREQNAYLDYHRVNVFKHSLLEP